MKLQLILFSFFSILGVANAQFDNCSKMSKNPKCWEGKDNTKFPRLVICPTKQKCGTIKTVKLTKWNYYSCTGLDGQPFDCTTLVKEYGENLEGEEVLITTPYVDACHVPGACGSRACMPSWGSASISLKC
jgi:hypothetical protein